MSTALISAAVALSVLTGVPATVDDSLIDVTPEVVQLRVPAPGHSTEWSMTATNTTAAAVPLTLEVTGAGGAALEGAHPMQVLVLDPDGVQLLADDVPSTLGEVVTLGVLAPGEEYTVRGTATLPAEAGDEYREATADVRYQFVAQAEEQVTGGVLGSGTGTLRAGPLAVTGAQALGILLAAAALIGAGTTAVLARRRKTR